METTRLLLTIVSVVMVTSLLIPCNDACTLPQGQTPPTLIEKIVQAPLVLYGRIVAKYTDLGGPVPTPHVYIAKMEVISNLKGPHVARYVNISVIGTIDGYCKSTKLEVKKLYVIPLQETLIPAAPAIPGAMLQKVCQACGLTPTSPGKKKKAHKKGQKKAHGVCKKKYTPETCLST